jgi:Zn-dependent peptidase ImmA (M78 family)/DNA-binding XRE family transcriptional regulator
MKDMTDCASADIGGWPRASVLQWAREQAAYEPEEAAESLNVSPEVIRAWEEGLEHPDIKTIQRLSLLYDLPFSYFFLESPQAEIPLRDYRGVPAERRARLSRETKLALREFRRLLRVAQNLQEITGSPILLEMGEVYPNEDPEQVAKREATKFGITRELRETWSSKEEAYHTWRRAIEALGIFVFSLRMPSLECRGAAIRATANAMGILVNQNDAPAARSFTLLHEYYHLMVKSDRELAVCDQFPGDDETSANRFAASVLLPEDEFSELLKEKKLDSYRTKWADATLSDLAGPFAVSRDVIAIRLEHLGFAPAGLYRQKRQHWDEIFRAGGGFGRRGKGKRELSREKLGDRFLDLALLAVGKGILHPIDAALYMGEVRGGKTPWVIRAKDIEGWMEQQG